jgi:peptidoglycan/LPS O-acetylase OafA/YrhL
LSSKRPHSAELDGVRGIAILLVLLYHCFWFGMDGTGWGPTALWAAQLAQWGRVGVNLFFILSGLLITGNLLDQKGASDFYQTFYLRRALRILPLYFLVLFVILIVYPHSGAFVFLCVIFLGDCAENFGVTPCYPVLWSLAIEEQFYLVWPWIVGNTKRKTLVGLCAVICALTPLLRAIAFHYTWSVQFWIWFDHFTWGALLACFLRSPYVSRRNLAALAAGLLALAILGWKIGSPFGIFDRTTLCGAALQYSWLMCLMTGFLAAALAVEGTAWGLPLRWNVLRAWGKVSYSAYLLHCLVLTPWDRNLADFARFLPASTLAQAVIRLGVGLVGTYLIASLTHAYLEAPLMKLGRRWRATEPLVPLA